MKMVEESWRDIIELGGRYSISNLGRIRRNAYSGHKFKCSEKIRDSKPRIHKAVATYFVENNLMLPIVNHKDGDKKNYHYSNLEWCSHSDNAKHAVSLSKNRHGENHHKSIISNQTVIMIADKIRAGESSKSIREQFNISSPCFWRIKSGVSYRNITGFELKEKRKRSPLTRDMVLSIKKMLLSGMLIKDVCIATGLSLSCISQISQNRHKFSNNG